MPRRHDRRAYIDRPFLDDHLASERDRRNEPRGFGGYLRWFLEGFWAETPERVHVAGVWFGRPARVDVSGKPVEDIPTELVGGSQLGAPKQAEPFRQLIENSPRQVAGDAAEEHYIRPMRAALARLASRDGERPLMARFLYQVAYAQGDWESVAERWFPRHQDGHPPVRDGGDRIECVCWAPRRAFAEKALELLFRCYRSEPPTRYLDERPGWVTISESQRSAVVAGEKGVA